MEIMSALYWRDIAASIALAADIVSGRVDEGDNAELAAQAELRADEKSAQADTSQLSALAIEFAGFARMVRGE